MKAESTQRTILTELLAWYDAAGRDLPWRDTRDPYEVLVSEVMLQQTQVPRVLIHYPAWLERFPTWESLASAGTAEVIRAWAGLGYNRRALALQEIARQIVSRGLPQSEDEWLQLKGIGPYTAAAMTVFALGKHAVPIDTNIRRVGARLLLGLPHPEAPGARREGGRRRPDGAIQVAPSGDAQLKPVLGRFLEGTRRFADLVQALFDLASRVCLKKPLCTTCPLAEACPVSTGFIEGRHPAPARTSAASRERKHRNKPHPDRIFRGRILRLVREAPAGLGVAGLGPLIDPAFDPDHDTSWLEAMIRRLADDGLIIRRGERLRLPG